MIPKRSGRIGGLIRAKRLSPKRRAAIARQGGSSRAKRLSAARRQAIAREAARARWNT